MQPLSGCSQEIDLILLFDLARKLSTSYLDLKGVSQLFLGESSALCMLKQPAGNLDGLADISQAVSYLGDDVDTFLYGPCDAKLLEAGDKWRVLLSAVRKLATPRKALPSARPPAMVSLSQNHADVSAPRLTHHRVMIPLLPISLVQSAMYLYFGDTPLTPIVLYMHIAR